MVYYYNLTLSFIAHSKTINETVITSAGPWRWGTTLNASEPRSPPESSTNAGHASVAANDAGADDDGCSS